MTQYNPDWVKKYYDEYGEQEWNRWDSGPVAQVKFYIHQHYLQKYLHKKDRVLDIGAGPGIFTREMAKIVKKIVVADISPVQLQLNRKNAKKYGYSNKVEKWIECDVCNLQAYFAKGEFDTVVCYGGPLSYVFNKRKKAIKQLLYVLKRRGVLILSVMSLWGTIYSYLSEILKVNSIINKKIIKSGDLIPGKATGAKHFCHMFRADEFRSFLKRSGVTIEVLSANSCISTKWGDYLKEIRNKNKIWKQFLGIELEACKEPGCLDMGTFLIAVCRKSK